MQLVRDFGNDNPFLPQQCKTQPEGGLGMQQVLPTVPRDKLRDEIVSRSLGWRTPNSSIM
jgi:hypothetical protein